MILYGFPKAKPSQVKQRKKKKKGLVSFFPTQQANQITLCLVEEMKLKVVKIEKVNIYG